MGETCPVCKTHQPFIATITADLGPARKAEEVIARKLKCGHIMGTKQHSEYLEKAAEIKKSYAAQLLELNENMKSDLLQAWEQLKESNK